MLRRGQSQEVHLQVLMLKDTVDQGIIEYAARKHSVVQGLVDGRPLNDEERRLLEDESAKIREGGFLAYNTMSPRQRARWIMGRMYGRGKNEIREFLAWDNGRYAKDFAEGYTENEESSYSANTARLAASLVSHLSVGRESSTTILDVACGCRTLERLFENSDRCRVLSVDINHSALEYGGKLLTKKKTEVDPHEVSAMDELPQKDESSDIAVLSLALDFTRHNRSRGKEGRERIRALSELNRVLKKDGHAILTFQERLFENKQAFHDFKSILAAQFGFEEVKTMSGLAEFSDHLRAISHKVWVLTLRKVANAEPNIKSSQLWHDLRFQRKDKVYVTAGREGKKVDYLLNGVECTQFHFQDSPSSTFKVLRAEEI